MEKFFDLEEINPGLRVLNERFKEIQKEFRDNKDRIVFINFGGEAGYYMKDEIAYKGWKVAPLYADVNDVAQVNGNLKRFENLTEINGDIIKFKLNTDILPTFTQTLLDSGIIKRVGISVVYPGQEIKWHMDPDPEKPGLAIIRGLFGLDIVEEEGKESFIYLKDSQSNVEKRVFKNNEFVFFWGRIRHKVENNLSEPRYMICFDTEVPYEKLNS